jgi:hypothetical protein
MTAPGLTPDPDREPVRVGELFPDVTDHLAELSARRRVDNRRAPADWPPSSWGPYVALRLFAQSLVALDEPSMVEARRITSLDDIIRRARSALAVRGEDT